MQLLITSCSLKWLTNAWQMILNFRQNLKNSFLVVKSERSMPIRHFNWDLFSSFMRELIFRYFYSGFKESKQSSLIWRWWMVLPQNEGSKYFLMLALNFCWFCNLRYSCFLMCSELRSEWAALPPFTRGQLIRRIYNETLRDINNSISLRRVLILPNVYLLYYVLCEALSWLVLKPPEIQRIWFQHARIHWMPMTLVIVW